MTENDIMANWTNVHKSRELKISITYADLNALIYCCVASNILRPDEETRALQHKLTRIRDEYDYKHGKGEVIYDG